MYGWLNGTFVPANLCVQFSGDANVRVVMSKCMKNWKFHRILVERAFFPFFSISLITMAHNGENLVKITFVNHQVLWGKNRHIMLLI